MQASWRLSGHNHEGKRYDAAGLVQAGTVYSLKNGKSKFGGTSTAPTVNGTPVRCGNIPTKNTTVSSSGRCFRRRQARVGHKAAIAHQGRLRKGAAPDGVSGLGERSRLCSCVHKRLT
jgi:hypothetical protein